MKTTYITAEYGNANNTGAQNAEYLNIIITRNNVLGGINKRTYQFIWGNLAPWSGSTVITYTFNFPFIIKVPCVCAYVNSGGSGGSVYSNFIDTKSNLTGFTYRTSATEQKTGVFCAFGLIKNENINQ